MKPNRKLPTVLIADDDPDARYLVERLLRRTGMSNPIVTVDGGAAAIEFLRSTCPAAGGRRSHKPAVAFIDVKMPQVDGFKVLRWVRKKKALQRTRIFMLSSSDLPRDRERAAELGADGYLVKYPAPSVLIKVLRAALIPGISH